MSIPVAVEAPSEAAARYRPEAFLLTTGADGRPHATHIVVEIDGACSAAVSVVGPLETPRSSRWCPSSGHRANKEGYSLIVDGEILIEHAEDEPVGTITATAAVPHRPLNAVAEDAACGSDCLRVEVPGTGPVEP